MLLRQSHYIDTVMLEDVALNLEIPLDEPATVTTRTKSDRRTCGSLVRSPLSADHQRGKEEETTREYRTKEMSTSRLLNLVVDRLSDGGHLDPPNGFRKYQIVEMEGLASLSSGTDAGCTPSAMFDVMREALMPGVPMTTSTRAKL